MKITRVCPSCGCELSPEALTYRCWCCNKSYSHSEIRPVNRTAPEQKEVISVRVTSLHRERNSAA